MNFEVFENALMKIIGPLALKVNNNQSLRAIAEGFMRTAPITLGIALFAILGNLPITAWTTWLTETGFKATFDAALGASTNVLSLYITFAIAYAFAKNKKHDGITAGFLALAGFIILMPQTVEGKESVVSALSTTYLGADGMLVALLVALFTGHLFCFLVDKGITFKMPDSVPPNVSQSLSPVFVAMIIFGCIIGVRLGFSVTSYGTLFGFITQIISIPLMNVGASLPSVLIILFLANVVWFFGIHPNTIQGPATPLFMMILLANIDAFQKGDPLPYLLLSISSVCASMGGNGNTLGLIISMFTAKSKRYKAMLKLSIIPNFFNINEPLIFGMPIMLNPIFFIPMTFSCVIMGLIGFVGANLLTIIYNPLMGLLPWTTPFIVKAVLAGGVPLLLLVLVALTANTLLYLPFFKIADRQACEAEAQEEAEQLKNEQATETV